MLQKISYSIYRKPSQLDKILEDQFDKKNEHGFTFDDSDVVSEHSDPNIDGVGLPEHDGFVKKNIGK